jgi:hypothetical protein
MEQMTALIDISAECKQRITVNNFIFYFISIDNKYTFSLSAFVHLCPALDTGLIGRGMNRYISYTIP